MNMCKLRLLGAIQDADWNCIGLSCFWDCLCPIVSTSKGDRSLPWNNVIILNTRVMPSLWQGFSQRSKCSWSCQLIASHWRRACCFPRCLSQEGQVSPAAVDVHFLYWSNLFYPWVSRLVCCVWFMFQYLYTSWNHCYEMSGHINNLNKHLNPEVY